MSNQQLIMENWRRYLEESDVQTYQRHLNEKVEEMDEGLRDLAFGALLTLGSMFGANQAQAGGIEKF